MPDWQPEPRTFVGRSDDSMVRATVTESLRVTNVRMDTHIDPVAAGEGIVQAVNRALSIAQAPEDSVDRMMAERNARTQEFDSLIDGFEANIARTRSRIHSREQ